MTSCAPGTRHAGGRGSPMRVTCADQGMGVCADLALVQFCCWHGSMAILHVIASGPHGHSPKLARSPSPLAPTRLPAPAPDAACVGCAVTLSCGTGGTAPTPLTLRTCSAARPMSLCMDSSTAGPLPSPPPAASPFTRGGTAAPWPASTPYGMSAASSLRAMRVRACAGVRYGPPVYTGQKTNMSQLHSSGKGASGKPRGPPGQKLESYVQLRGDGASASVPTRALVVDKRPRAPEGFTLHPREGQERHMHCGRTESKQPPCPPLLLPHARTLRSPNTSGRGLSVRPTTPSILTPQRVPPSLRHGDQRTCQDTHLLAVTSLSLSLTALSLSRAVRHSGNVLAVGMPWEFREQGAARAGGTCYRLRCCAWQLWGAGVNVGCDGNGLAVIGRP